MLRNRHSIEQNIVLWAKAKAQPHSVDLRLDVKVIDQRLPRSRRKHSGQHGECRCLTGPVVTEESCNLTLVHVEGQAVDGNFILAINL